MSKKGLRGIVCAALVGSALGIAPTARASHHLMQITEVFMGTGGAADAIFVELTTLSSSQNQVSGHNVVFQNAAGDAIETATFTTNPSDASGSGGSILVASTQAETLFGVTADLEFDPTGISEAGGKVCFNSTGGFGTIDCVSWGNYSGDSSETGNPFGPTEGIPSGASILRNEERGNPDAYDSADDTDNSRRDFFMSSPFPAGGGTPTETPGRIQFTTNAYTVDEGETTVMPVVTRTGDITELQAVSFQTRDATATKGADYDHSDTAVPFPINDNEQIVSIDINDDVAFEGAEKVKLRLRNPSNGAVLGSAANATLTITDPEDDNEPPKTRITKPEHGNTYARDNLTKIKGTADDGPGEINDVDVALRRNMVDGSCRHFNGTSWQPDACSSFSYLGAQGTETWSFAIDPLKKSVGTDIKSYTVTAIASDVEHNTETFLKKGRNKNTFEVN